MPVQPPRPTKAQPAAIPAITARRNAFGFAGLIGRHS
jgi:hypothetical protein